MAKTYEIFRFMERSINLDFSKYLLAANYSTKPEKAVEVAEVEGMTARELREWWGDSPP
jgi:hypothetical protein